MKKPSRRRGPLLRPLRISPRLHRLTRFILFHSHPLRLRMGKRGRQIRRSAPMGNIRKLNRGRFRATSSSKVEAASMSEKCEIQLDADPIQGASGGPGQVSQVSNFQATHRGPSSRPPLDLLPVLDKFKSLETDRLVPYLFYCASSRAEQQYDAYLQWFYDSHRGPVRVVSPADAASECLEKENSMLSLWLDSEAFSNPPIAGLSDVIRGYMDTVIRENGEIEHPFAFDAAECLTKETELICAWLRCGQRSFTTYEYHLSDQIRGVAAQLIYSRRKWSLHICAALLGIRKETERMIENLERNSGESTNISMKIKRFAIDYLKKKFQELEPVCYVREYDLSKFETETDETETDSESDDDVFVDTYVGDCYDVLVKKYFG